MKEIKKLNINSNSIKLNRFYFQIFFYFMSHYMIFVIPLIRRHQFNKVETIFKYSYHIIYYYYYYYCYIMNGNENYEKA
jgi:hypothetical protein